MAIHLTQADSLFVHIPKTGGHWVEKAIKAAGIKYSKPRPVRPVCPRHGRRSDYPKARHAWAVCRNIDQWMWSYWKFCLPITADHWLPGVEYPYKQFGPPMLRWDEFNTCAVRARVNSFHLSYISQVNETLGFGRLSEDLPQLLRGLGYDIKDGAFDAVPHENVTKVRLEFGGGTRQYDDGQVPRFCNVDVTPNANIHWNLDEFPYPFCDDLADEIYTSHCLEHLKDPQRTLKEFARIGKIGAKVVVKVPHPNSEMAMVSTHKSIISPQQMENLDVHFPEILWGGLRKRLKLASHHINPSSGLAAAKKKLPFLQGVHDQDIMRFIAGTAHETVFTFRVVEQ